MPLEVPMSFATWWRRVLDALEAAGPEMASFLERNEAAMEALAKQAFTKKVEDHTRIVRVSSASEMTLDEAKAWVWSTTERLAALPPPTAGKDHQGFAASNDGPLRHWLTGGEDQPVPTYLGAAEYLRIHSNVQFSGDEWKEAISAIRAATPIDEAAARQLLRGGARTGHDYGENKDGRYKWFKTHVAFDFSEKRKPGTSLKSSVLVAAGFDKPDVRWKIAWKNGIKQFYLLVAPHRMLEFSDFLLEKGRPAMAAALRAQSSVWLAEAAEAPVVTRPSRAPKKEVAKIEVQTKPRGALRVLFADYGSSQAARGAVRLRGDFDDKAPRERKYWWIVKAKDIATVAEAIRGAGYSLDAAVLLKYVPEEKVIPDVSSMAMAGSLAEIRDPELRSRAIQINTALSWPDGLRPFPYQQVGIAFSVLNGGRSLIADDMGLGKTIQALGVLQHHNLPTIIVCPSSMLYTWPAEISRWVPSYTATAIPKTKSDIPKAARGVAIVLTWDMMRRRIDELKGWGAGLVIADEAHYAKNYKAGRSVALKTLAGLAENVTLLTGTPAENGLEEMFSLLNMLDPEAWPSYAKFVRTYLDAEKGRYGWELGAPTNIAQFKRETGKYMIRRLKSEVGNLPEKSRRFVTVPLEGRAAASYRKAQRDFAKIASDNRKTKALASAAVKIANGADPNVVFTAIRADLLRRDRDADSEQPGGAQALVALSVLRQLVGEIKAHIAVDWVKSFIKANPSESLLVFVEHHKTADILSKGLAKADIYHALATGSVSAKRKFELQESFQAGSLPVLIGSSAIREGMTLHRANTVLFVERWWVPSRETQAEDRIHRTGQTRNATINYLMLQDTVDEYMHQLIEDKRENIEAGLRGNEVATSAATESGMKQAVMDRIMADMGDTGAAPTKLSRVAFNRAMKAALD